MSLFTKNIIQATSKIHQMTFDDMQNMLLKVLENNPSVIFNALDINNTKPDELFKVVLSSLTDNKISLIKAFREITGAGLAEAKHWSEGKTYNGLPSGVFGNNLTNDNAIALRDKIIKYVNCNSFVVNIIKNDNRYDKFEYRSYITWKLEY